MHHKKVLFILKKKKLYDTPYDGRTIHSGLFNSATFVNDMLNDIGIESHFVPVIGSNEIAWLNSLYKASTTSSDDIVKKMKRAYFLDMFNVQVLNKWNLIRVGKNAVCTWRKYFKHW